MKKWIVLLLLLIPTLSLADAVRLGGIPSRAQMGVDNVDNTSDANKPVSTAQAIAINAKADKAQGFNNWSAAYLTKIRFANRSTAVSAQLVGKQPSLGLFPPGTVLAGPVSGGAATPTARALTAGEVGALAQNGNSSASGVVGINSGGSGARSARLNLFDGTQGGSNPDASIHVDAGAGGWLQIDNNTPSGYIRLNTASNNGTWTQAPIAVWSKFSESELSASPMRTGVSSVVSSMSTTSSWSSPFGGWDVSANSKSSAATGSMAVGREINTLERYADQGYMESRIGRATIGLQVVPESELDTGDGTGISRGYNGTFGVGFHHSSGADYGDAGRTYNAAKWHNPLFFDTDSTTHTGTQILSNGGSTAPNAPNIFIKAKGYQGTGIDLSAATFSGPAIKVGSAQTFTDGTVTRTLAQLAADDTVYGAGWNGDTTHAPSKNAVYDKIEALAVSGSSGTVGSGTTGQFAYYGSDGTTVTGHTLVSGDIPAIAESQVTNLATDLAAKAPLASPALTGSPSVVPTLGINMVTNGTFITDPASNWTITGWTWGSGKVAHNTGNTSALIQSSVSIVAGNTYRITYDVSGMSAGTTVNVSTSYGGGIAHPIVTADVAGFSYIFTATANSSLGFNPSSTFTGAIDNVSLVQVTGGNFTSGDGFYISNDGYSIGVGTSTPAAPFEVLSDGARSGIIMVTAYSGGDNTNQSPSFVSRGARGTPSAPIASKTNDQIGGLSARAHDGTAFSAFAKGVVGIYAGENWTSTAQGTYIGFQTTAIGGTTRTEKMTLSSVGNLTVTGTSTALNSIYSEGTSSPSTTGTVTINAATVGHYELTPTGTTTQTIAFSGNPAAGKVTYVGIHVTTAASGVTTLAWPSPGSTFGWLGSTAGATTLAASKNYEYACRVEATKTWCAIVGEGF